MWLLAQRQDGIREADSIAGRRRAGSAEAPFTLLFTWFRLLRGMVKGASEDPAFRALLATIAGLLIVGTLFFSVNQDWSLVDSFYFCVNTLTTVGYGDLTPTGDGAKLATVAYELAGIGLFVLLLSELARRSMLRHGVDASQSTNDPESDR